MELPIQFTFNWEFLKGVKRKLTPEKKLLAIETYKLYTPVFPWCNLNGVNKGHATVSS